MSKAFLVGVCAVATSVSAATWLGCTVKATTSATGGNDAGGSANDAGALAEAGDDAGDDAEPAQGDAGPQPQCDDYCNAIMATCKGDVGTDGGLAQYATAAGCANLCNAMNAGALGDTTGDTLGCRLVHAAKAKTNPQNECAIAGSTGGGVCEDENDASDKGRCASFCNKTVALCTQANGVDPMPYADFDACMRACGTSYTFDAKQAELTPMGNTLNCRQYHLMMAYDTVDGGTGTENAVYHCPHLAFPASAFCR